MAESEEELKSLLMRVKEESEKAGLKLNIQKRKIKASGPITSWQIDGETMETVTDFFFLGYKITVDDDCSHETKTCLFLGRNTMTNLDSILEKEMAARSSTLAWRILWMEEPGGLPSMGLHRVGCDWSNLAAAAADSILKSRGIPLPTKVYLVKAIVFPVVSCGWESWTIRKAEQWRTDTFKLWYWRRLLRILWTARRSNQKILK